MSVDLSKYLSVQKEAYPVAYSHVLNKQYDSGWVDFVFPRLLSQCDSPRSTQYGLNDIKMARAFWKNKLLRSNYIYMLKAIQQMNPNDFHMVFTPRAKIKMMDSINLFMELIGDDAIYTEEYNLLNVFKNDYLNYPAVK